MIGATQAAIHGGNILEGAAIGATAAWIGWNTFGAAAGMLENVITSSLGYCSSGTLAASAWGGAIAGGAAAGATADGLSAGMHGGNIGGAALSGARYGASGGAVFGAIGTPTSLWQVGAYALAGGGLSSLAGGSFGDGALTAGSLALACYGYYGLTDIGNGGRLPSGELSDGTAIVKTDNPKIDLPLMDANRNKSWFGGAAIRSSDLNLPGQEGWGPFKWLTSHVPFANNIAYAHDFGWGRLLHGYWNPVTNYSTMLPAAVLTFGGAAAYYSPLTNGIIFGMRE